MGAASVELPPGAFLQASPSAEEAMAAFAVEAAAGAIGALARASGSAPGLKSITASARDLDRRPLLAADLAGFDAVVLDPPRAGAAAQCGELARSACPRVIAVSCNPATFARDARILADGGYRLDRVLPVDQFLWSPHIELVGVFSRGSS
jgi:23S rRNA (uracil1939-C5)-methyltransferase